MSVNIYDEKLSFRNLLVEYFGNIILTKIKSQNNFSLYYAKVGCMLCVEDRFIVVFTKEDNTQIGTRKYLSNMDWICFQTRTINPSSLKFHLDTQQLKQSFSIHDRIQLHDKKNDRYIYLCENYPIFLPESELLE